jgi:hypothetical protein
MSHRSTPALIMAARMRRCSVKVRIPPGGLGLGLGELTQFLRDRLGADGFEIVPTVWGWGPDAAAVVFDDAGAAPEIAAWLDRKWPPAG